MCKIIMHPPCAKIKVNITFIHRNRYWTCYLFINSNFITYSTGYNVFDECKMICFSIYRSDTFKQIRITGNVE